MPKVHVDVWSDIACPWCYVGKRRLEAALESLPYGDDVEITWHAFELDPTAPPVLNGDVDYPTRLAKKYRTTPDQGQAMCDRMTEVAAGDGLAFRFDRIRPGNTFDAHRLVHLGQQQGRQDAVKERFLRAYLEEGEAIGDREVLERLAVEAGLDVDEVRRVLGSDEHAEDVRRDEATARALGVTGVPFFVIDHRVGVSGAQSAEVLAKTLSEAYAQAAESEVVEGAACGPDGC